MHRKLKLATKIKRNFGAKHSVRQKDNRTFVKRNSYSNVREDLGRRKMIRSAVMNYKKGEHMEMGHHNTEQWKFIS
jgi:hypothetical protein